MVGTSRPFSLTTMSLVRQIPPLRAYLGILSRGLVIGRPIQCSQILAWVVVISDMSVTEMAVEHDFSATFVDSTGCERLRLSKYRGVAAIFFIPSEDNRDGQQLPWV